MAKQDKKIVVIGGGTGSFTLLSGLKEYTKNITALVNMSDDGGSTGVLRDELGVLPPGDIRQCLVALSDSSKLRDLFNYRFDNGSLDGHSFGNLFLSAVEKMTDSFEEAVEIASDVLNIQGKVVPITTDKVRLILEQSDGETVREQFKIGQLNFAGKSRPHIYFDPPAKISKQGRATILEADTIVIAPGNLYGSLAPTLIVDGVADALKETKARIIYICNLVTKPNQTDGFKVQDYVDEIERFVGAKVLDYVIYNTDEPPEQLLNKYLRDNEKIVKYDARELGLRHYESIGLPLIASQPSVYSKSDKIAAARSLIRHDSDILAQEIMKI